MQKLWTYSDNNQKLLTLTPAARHVTRIRTCWQQLGIRKFCQQLESKSEHSDINTPGIRHFHNLGKKSIDSDNLITTVQISGNDMTRMSTKQNVSEYSDNIQKILTTTPRKTHFRQQLHQQSELPDNKTTIDNNTKFSERCNIIYTIVKTIWE